MDFNEHTTNIYRDINSKKLEVNVLKVQQPIGDFYIASLNALELVEIAYTDVRRLVTEERDVEKYLGVQRPLSSKRVKEIKKYVCSPDATFPTSVIIAIDERCVTYNPKSNMLLLEPYIAIDEPSEESIPYNKIARVLDGQHRIAGFIQNEEFDKTNPFDINVAIFVGADISDQANIFATVNLAQTKVRKSLVYDLTELAETKSPYKTCHNVAVALDSIDTSPFYSRIKRLGVATPGRKHETLTQATFVESLVKFISINPTSDRNMLLEGKSLPAATKEELIKCPFRNLFIEDNDFDIAEILYNYFEAVRIKWPDSWNAVGTKNLLPKSNAFKAFMRYLKEDVYIELVGEDNIGKIPSVSDFEPFFENVRLSDSDFNSQNFIPGGEGQATFLKILRDEIKLDEFI